MSGPTRSRWASATSSSRRCRAQRRRRPAWLPAALLVVGLALAAGSAAAKVFHSQKEGLRLAFPEADRLETRTYILGPGRAAAVEERSHAELESRIVKLHVGYRGDELLGYALIDVHRVRTLPEAFLIVLDPAGSVRSLRVLAFHEPLDYLPTERWYRQFEGRTIDDRLKVGDDLHGVVGATLSTRAVSDAVRRALALKAVLVDGGATPSRTRVESLAGAGSEPAEPGR